MSATPLNDQQFPGSGVPNTTPGTPAPPAPLYAMDLSTHAVVSAPPSAIPLNPPAAHSAIPVNVPRAAHGYTPGAPPQPMPSQSPYAMPGQYPPAPGAANPYPAQMPSGYQVPNQPPNMAYNAPQNTGYRSLSSAEISAGPNIAMGALAGILLMIVCGLGFGFISVAAGFRIPYLSLGIGYLIGYAVLYASKENGDVQGVIGGVCSLLACLIGLGIMYMNNIYFSPFAFIIVAFATYRGYAIPAGD